MISQSLSFLNTYGVFLLYLGAAFYFWDPKKKKIVAHIIVSGILAGALVLVLKELYFSPRPFFLDGTQPLAGQVQLSGFPSLHAALAFSLATVVRIKNKKVGTIMIFLAILVAAGRVMARVHFPLDIIAGSFIGILTAYFVDLTL